MTRVLIDTDIGTDVDDLLALTLGLSSPEITIEAITCSYADVDLRARMVAKLLDLHPRGGTIPIATGAREPLLGLRPVVWKGFEGKGFITDGDRAQCDPRPAAQLIADTILANPGEIEILALGPLTTIAAALLATPAIVGAVKRITVMGGSFHTAWTLPLTEHNIRVDAEAARVVLTSGVPLRIVPLDVTLRTRLAADGVEAIRAGGTALHAAVADQIEAFPPFAERGYAILHDPLAMATMISPAIVQWTELEVEVNVGGSLLDGATVGRAPASASVSPAPVSPAPVSPASVATDVDPAAAVDFIVSRLAGPLHG